MIKLSAAQIIEATGGTAIGLEGREEQVYADFATTDSREVQTGTLFVAKPGAVTDGHRFIPMAFERARPWRWSSVSTRRAGRALPEHPGARCGAGDG